MIDGLIFLFWLGLILALAGLVLQVVLSIVGLLFGGAVLGIGGLISKLRRDWNDWDNK
jgi:hypothetical protein